MTSAVLVTAVHDLPDDGVSAAEIKRWAMDTSDWMWGMVQGAWNEKQTTSQIIVDAVIGMIPLVGDVTAVRDLIAVATHLAQDPKRREQVTEWVLLVVLLFALIPVFGGVIKGVGRLLLKLGKSAAENQAVIREIVTFLNRIGHGDAVKYLRELNLLKYQDELLAKFNQFFDKLDETLKAIKKRLSWFLSPAMMKAIDEWIEWFAELKRLGAKMIPEALKDLHERLKIVQKELYEGEWHTVSTGTKATTREAEARLIDDLPARPKRNGYAQNKYEDYVHKEGWPDLRKSAAVTFDAKTGKKSTRYTQIEAFSGPISATTLRGPMTIYRIIDDAKKGKKGRWWAESLPSDAKEWREGTAVLDEFNRNGFFVKYDIPDGTEIKAWRGRAAEQIDSTGAQYLPGGSFQLFIDTSEITAWLERLPAYSTGWGRTTKQFGYDERSRATIAARAETLRPHEFESKLPHTTSGSTAAVRGIAANERSDTNKP